MSWSGLVNYFENDLWRQTFIDEHDRRKRVRVSTLKVLTLCVRGFIDKGINTLANSLTYSLMFAIVPILAMILAIAQGFGFADIIEDYLNKSFLGDYHVVPIIMEMVQRYLDTAQGGVFIGIGLLILLWAVYSFFQNVESAFNDIWNVSRSRSIMRQVVTYLAILLLVPILLVVSSGLFSAVSGFLGDGYFGRCARASEAVLPYITSWIIFSWMYKAIPNTHVSHWACLIPGIIMGTFFQLLQWALVHFVVIVARTSIVYGAFAIVPIFLMCMQWMCLLILIGAQLSFAIQNNEMFEYEKDIRQISHRYSRFLSLYIMARIVERFCADESPLSAHDIATLYRIPIRLVQQLLHSLVQSGLLREVYVEDKESRTFQPAMDTSLLSVGMINDRLDSLGQEHFLNAVPDSLTEQWSNYCRLREQHNSLSAINIREL